MLDYQQKDRGWCGDPSRGAAMGRGSDLELDTTAALHIRRVPLDGDYDPGGTYWGGGPGTEPLYCAWDDEGHVHYLRAPTLDDAKKSFPHATWAPETGPTEDDITDMLDGYVAAALWSTNDNSDEALVVALELDYATAWDLLYAMQGEHRRCSFGLVDDLVLRDPRLHVVRELSFPAVRGKPRMTGTRFCGEYGSGHFILRMAHHVVAVVDGHLFDSWDSSGKCVYTAWEV